MLTFNHHYNTTTDPKSDAIIKKALNTVTHEMQSDTVGYYKLPKGSMELLPTLESIDMSGITQIVVMGIGGSSLGLKAVDALLRPYTLDAKEILYFENSDPLTIVENLAKVRGDEALFFIISKSGSTIETTSILKKIIDCFHLELSGKDQKRLMVVTDEGSVLSDFAKHHGLREFNIPHNVGGRFSILSAVGIAPLTLAGFDTKGLLEGAAAMVESFFGGKEPHLLSKALHLYQNSSKESINVLFSYADRLENLTKWYVQLWGESLGKIDTNGKSVGLTPIGLIGAVDQHSFLQLIIEGPKDKSVTFIKIEDFQREIAIPNITLHGIEKTNFINGKNFGTLINAQADATLQSIIDSGINCDTITLDIIDAHNAGSLLAYYELLTSLVGAMFEVNTYDQPGVELGKVILYKNLS